VLVGSLQPGGKMSGNKPDIFSERTDILEYPVIYTLQNIVWSIFRISFNKVGIVDMAGTVGFDGFDPVGQGEYT
jgi:hypothetical protein